MVLSVCRRTLHDANDADDAFQGTFIVLMKKAAGLKQPERLGPWLYGVAHRVALRLRKRRRAAGLPAELPARSAERDPAEVEQLAVVHDEIQRLPEKYRLPIVLCCVDEETHDEAARKLGWPVGTVHGRLSRGRDLLRGRLGRRGVVIPEMISRPAGTAAKRREKAVPEPLLRSTLALIGGPLPTQLHTLARGVLSAMFIERLKTTGFVLALTTLGVASAATALMAVQEPAKKALPPGSNGATQGITAEVKKVYGKALDDPFGAGASDDGQAEAIAEKLGKMRANVEMLELRKEALRKAHPGRDDSRRANGGFPSNAVSRHGGTSDEKQTNP